MFFTPSYPTNPDPQCIQMSFFFAPEKAIAIAISLLKHNKPEMVHSLKDLLTFISNPDRVSDILTTAVIELVRTCPPSALWLFDYPTVLEPEIQVKEVIARELSRVLLSWGYGLEEFYFTADRYLEMTAESRQSLLFFVPDPSDECAFVLIRALLVPETIAWISTLPELGRRIVDKEEIQKNGDRYFVL